MADMTRELDRLNERLEQQISKARRQTTISVVVGIIVIVILLIYFGVMSGMASDALEPKGVAQFASTEISEQIPEVRTLLEREAKTAAPQMVNNLLDNAINQQLPQMRSKAEDTLKTEIEKEFNNYEGQVKDAIDEALEKHSENIQAMIQQLQTEEGTREFENSLFQTIDEAIQSQEVQVELQTYGMALAEIDAMLKSLANDGEFYSEEQRRLVRLMGILRELANRSELGTVDLEE